MANALSTLKVESKLLVAAKLVGVVSRLLLKGCWLVVALMPQVVSLSKLLAATKLAELVSMLLLKGCWLVVVLRLQVKSLSKLLVGVVFRLLLKEC